MKNQLLLFALSGMVFFACKNPFSSEKSDLNPLTLPTFTEKGINVVVEIPAGTNHKIEVNKTTGAFENDSINGKVRVVNFLPYPGNYGFIPSTIADKKRGGDGDALDILVISESQPTGTVLDVLPIGVLLLDDAGESDSKIIGVPVDSSQNTLQAFDFQQLTINHQAAQKLIEDWFLNYKGVGKMEFKGWRDENYAMKEIRKWLIVNDER